MLRAWLLTRGAPGSLSGGHLYHQRMMDAAAGHGVVLRVMLASAWRPPPHGDIVIVDSIATTRAVPWIMARGDRAWAAMVHQQPGGVDAGPLGRWARRAVDGFVYRRCRTVIAASPRLAEELV